MPTPSPPPSRVPFPQEDAHRRVEGEKTVKFLRAEEEHPRVNGTNTGRVPVAAQGLL